MKKLIPFILLFFALNVFSQKEANFWYFGNGAALDFNSGTPVPVTGSLLNTTEGCSSFADANGDLLFYVGAPSPSTANLTIWDRNNTPMTNGVGLNGDASSSQSALTVPAPGKPNIYYLFTVGAQSSGNAGFWYYTIDMTANGGLGDIVDGPVVLGNAADHSNWTEKVTAVKGDECDTFWVISSIGNEFYAYKVDDTGVLVSSPQISTINGYDASDARGYLKVSPDGTKLVAANMGAGTFLFNFNDVTGEVTNFNNSATPNRLDTSGNNGYGVEFSASSRRLYISTGNFGGDTENLYQFDLTQAQFTDINTNRFTVHSYFNTRGALQLGPDSKIYWTSDNSNNISVINNPEELGAAVDYSHQSINLGTGASATQGLPPFLSSLLLPLKLTDSSTNEEITNQDLQFCVGESKTIIPEAVTGTNITYEWEFDNGTTKSIIANTGDLVLNNLQKTDSGKYTLTIKLTDDCGKITQFIGTFNVEVFDAARAKAAPDAINFCDTDDTTPNNFDLATLKNTEILDGLDATVFNVLYFDTMAKATANVAGSDLPNPYQVNTASSQTIYARVQNISAPNACFALTNFILEVTNEPEPVQPSVYRLCDDTGSGSDIDGISSFRLSTKDAEILGTLSATQYSVSYHTLLADAQTSSTTNAIDKTVDYAVTNSQRIYVRVENIDNTNCNAISNDTAGSSFMSFELIVDPLPIVNDPAELIQCHNDPSLSTTVNLRLARPNISNNSANETFEYYRTLADANAGTPQITGSDVEMYPVTGTGEAWVRVISDQNCYRVSKIDITVNFSADLLYNKTYEECDDLLDADGNNTLANSDTDGITYFDFSDSEDEIKAFFPITSQPDLDVFFYETESDRTASINAIPDITRHRNNSDPSFANNQTIYAKIVNSTNNGCSGTAQFTLQVNAVPLANPVADLELCDDALSGNTTDGENININLRDNVPTILGTTQTEADYIVTFHTSQNDADDVTTTGITNDTNFRNTAQAGFTAGDISEQTIFVRVLDRNANPQCKNTAISFKIIVNPIPEVSNTITPLAVCDVATPTDSDPRNRIAQSIDLTSKNIEILNGRTNHRVAYYATQQHAVDGTPEITNPSNFQNDPSQTAFPSDFNTDDPGIQTIFFAVVDQGGNMCRSVFSTYQLLIYPEPNIPINISDYTDCDNTTDTEMDDTNGRNGDISLKNKIPEILANYQPAEFPDFDVTFYTSLAEAESGDKTLALDEDKFENSINNQTIYVRVENTKNTPVVCVHTRLSFNINIIPLPEFTVTGEDPDNPQILCLNYTTPHILEAENPASGYDYEWTDKNGTVLGTDQTQIVDKGGEYTVKATNTTTTCSRSRTIYVKESEKATLLEEYVTIIDESNNIGSQDNISIFIDTIKNSLGKGDYQFAVRNDDNGERIPFAGFQDEPLFENLEGGVYTIIVNDKNGCIADETLQISVIQFPKFFTPNGDGKNDTWVVKGANKDFYPNASINIFDRYGKLVAQIPIDSQGWNGTYNGKVLSSDDYWYNVQLIPADPTKQQVLKKGHFSLLRK
ncbi:T9SS type B sorting domain-containing protein [Polaribacter pectinis]|uniref:T9SS type B sorting domain-containing protein n=1 Tax=Polaribacter pectinis TaxID=2738844 RepID=A0A7G9LDE9_9FLAO|nr:T9SS type B sorting domain-containing protein [Polaribacter pectinis]QNM86648.1 T9SS type B sorting domain-containing protein [Polaribacter pectinis]